MFQTGNELFRFQRLPFTEYGISVLTNHAVGGDDHSLMFVLRKIEETTGVLYLDHDRTLLPCRKEIAVDLFDDGMAGNVDTRDCPSSRSLEVLLVRRNVRPHVIS